MKEKIWKLLELLNEYHHFNSDLIYYWWDEECERVYFHTELPEEQKEKLAKAGIDDEWIDEQRIDDERIISKKFWFIKWLVENDKIDREQFYDKARKIITDFDLRWEYEWACNEIIMLLSISDTPIDLLCSLLK